MKTRIRYPIVNEHGKSFGPYIIFRRSEKKNNKRDTKEKKDEF